MQRLPSLTAAMVGAGSLALALFMGMGLAAPQVAAGVQAEVGKTAPGITAQASTTATVTADDAATALAEAGTANTGTLVVQLDGAQTRVRAIAFTEPISGLEALLRSDLAVTWTESSFGPAVCAIEDVGCPADNCFCDAKRYWSYAYWDGATWQSYPVGASQAVISTTGAIEGWRWSEGEPPHLGGAAAEAAVRGLGWLRSQQDAKTGGYGDGLGGAVEVMLALGANGEQLAEWRPTASGTDTAPSLADFVRRRATLSSRQGVAEAGKLAVAQVATDSCRTHRSLQPSSYYSDTLGAFAPDNGFNAWGILGTVALSQSVPAGAVDALRAQQQPNGGWEWQAGFGTDTNTTALAIQALVAAGEQVTASTVVSGLAFLQSGRLEDGGIVYDPAMPENGADANSTAYTLLALAATGQDPAAEPWTVDGVGPTAFLLSLQQPNGGFAWQAGTPSNLLATAQAVTALLGRAYPAAVHELPSCIGRGK